MDYVPPCVFKPRCDVDWTHYEHGGVFMYCECARTLFWRGGGQGSGGVGRVPALAPGCSSSAWGGARCVRGQGLAAEGGAAILLSMVLAHACGSGGAAACAQRAQMTYRRLRRGGERAGAAASAHGPVGQGGGCGAVGRAHPGE